MAVSTRDRLLQAAHDLFYRDGFQTVGLDQIIDEVGVTKTTFYNHFESKDDLIIQVLRKHDKWWQNGFRDKLREYGGDTPRGQLLAVFDVIDELIRQPGYMGCIFINVAVQFPLAHDPAHQEAVRHKAAMEGILREVAGYAGADDPAMLAKEFALLMEGTYVTSQITGDSKPIEVGRRLSQMLIDKHLPVTA
ncbi:MAG: TetR/AcrR family transcriptional regulator [Phycisphaerales bacterium]|nr:TetR/AcrR family transcriptional regulator [Phycisphaerales bacterium]